MNADDYRREFDRMLQQDETRARRRLALRLTGWALLLAAVAVVAWVAVDH